MEDSNYKSLGDYLNILLRRKKTVIFPAILLSIVVIIVANILPATYKSQGLILIESQEIPTDLVKTTVTSYAAQRIEFIKQKIMTTAKIMETVDKYNLYADKRKKVAESEIVGMFRQNLQVSMVEANVTDPRSGHRRKATIAFTVSFMDESPENAQKVTNDLVTEFLSENVKTRTDRAAETKDFLQEEANKFQRKIQLLEKEIADFKDQYSDSLPELLEYNLETTAKTQEAIASNKSQRMALQDQITTMSLELANISPYLEDLPVNSSGKPLNTPAKQLAAAEDKYAQLSSKYSSSHPDLTRLKRQIEQLKIEVAQAEPTSEQASSEVQTANDGKVINPVYLQIKSKIDSSEREIIRLEKSQLDLEAKLEDFDKRVYKTHQVKRAYDDLTRDHENNLAKYRELRAKQLEAELAQNLESENKGESFTLIEPPTVPTKSEKPNRPKLMTMGVIASIGIGVGLAFVIEFVFGGVRGQKEITRIVGQTPLVILPIIKTLKDEENRRAFNRRMFYLSLFFMLLLVIVFHFYVMNLELVWYKVMTKISLL